MNTDWITPETLARFAAEGTDLHRLYTGSRGWIERYGADLLFCLQQPGWPDDTTELRADLRHWQAHAHFTPGRIFVKTLRQGPGAEKYTLLEGDPALPLQTVCTEAGLKYKIDFDAGYSTGFFIDQRENRRFLRALKPKNLLNLFAYTCSFSVAAASVGAETTSIDVAKKALDWGRENFALNGLELTPPATHRFWPDDVRDVLRRQQQRGAKFAVIILDPPTFARNQKGKAFRVTDELPELTRQALPLLEPGGHLLLSTNCERLIETDLADWAEDAARAEGRKLEKVEIPALEDIPAGHGAITHWVKRLD